MTKNNFYTKENKENRNKFYARTKITTYWTRTLSNTEGTTKEKPLAALGYLRSRRRYLCTDTVRWH